MNTENIPASARRKTVKRAALVEALPIDKWFVLGDIADIVEISEASFRVRMAELVKFVEVKGG